MKLVLPKINFKNLSPWFLVAAILWIGVSTAMAGWFWWRGEKLAAESRIIENRADELRRTLTIKEDDLASISASLSAFLSEDQYVRNEALEAEIKAIQSTYGSATITYEDLIDLRGTTKTTKLDERFAGILDLLAKRNYATAAAEIKTLDGAITAEVDKAVAEFKIPENVPVNNSPPGSGYSRQQVQIDIGTYMVSIVTADLNSTRVVVDTASEGDCANDCPVLSLGDYVGRSGAFAGINGPYFCPASYPSCAGKTNSFDTLLMNKNKKYFNSDNNVYSNVPVVVFSGSSARFMGRSLEWGRDTGVDAVIANQPLLVSGGNVVFGGDGDPKKGSKGGRSFIGASGSTAYIGVVHNATVAEAARVLAAMGIQNALNLDSGGSTALWSGGYKVGPGRNTPFGILLVRK
jgi:hypothetical protein